MDDLYKAYSPSYWSKRFSSSEETVKHHIKFIEEASDKTRKTIPCLLDVPYGNTERTKIDILGTDLLEGAPTFVFVHGGYWQETSITRSSYHFIAENLYRHNIKSIFIGYDLCPEVTIPQIMKQVESAAKKCLEYAKEKKSPGIYFVGHSAGAHLVASLFANFIKLLSKEERAIVKGAVLISGVFDLTPIQKTAINDLLKLDERTAFELSPLSWRFVDGAKTAFYSIVGEHESPEFIGQSKDFSGKLLTLGFQSQFAVIKCRDHFDILERLVDHDYEVTKLIIELITRK